MHIRTHFAQARRCFWNRFVCGFGLLCCDFDLLAMQQLPESHRRHCMGRALQLTRETAHGDPIGWQAARDAAGPNASIWHYLTVGLRNILGTTKKIGQAGWKWQTGAGHLTFGFIFACGSSQSEQSMPLHPGDSHSLQCWPIIFLAPPGGGPWIHIIIPMMCPALVAQRARPWFTHGSRCFTFHAGWFDDLP